MWGNSTPDSPRYSIFEDLQLPTMHKATHCCHRTPLANPSAEIRSKQKLQALRRRTSCSHLPTTSSGKAASARCTADELARRLGTVKYGHWGECVNRLGHRISHIFRCFPPVHPSNPAVHR
nr:hypothetical protein CFP56_12968 [Quercus suber]